ncbi:hypothetical protein C8J57DRAFT_1721062 [Mycena rebaudengoi]|nr:hypothetical protein C8J57DRAFT_1721062 [Mycena rebaudengoi]
MSVALSPPAHLTQGQPHRARNAVPAWPGQRQISCVPGGSFVEEVANPAPRHRTPRVSQCNSFPPAAAHACLGLVADFSPTITFLVRSSFQHSQRRVVLRPTSSPARSPSLPSLVYAPLHIRTSGYRDADHGGTYPHIQVLDGRGREVPQDAKREMGGAARRCRVHQTLIQAQTPRTTRTSSSRAERVSGLARPAADVEIKDIRLSSNARSRLIPPHDTARYEGPHSTRSRPPQRKGVSASSRMCPDQILVGRSQDTYVCEATSSACYRDRRYEAYSTWRPSHPTPAAPFLHNVRGESSRSVSRLHRQGASTTRFRTSTGRQKSVYAASARIFNSIHDMESGHTDASPRGSLSQPQAPFAQPSSPPSSNNSAMLLNTGGDTAAGVHRNPQGKQAA